MPAYTPPATNAVNFALGTFTPADNTPHDSPLASVVPPALDAADFALVAYTQPADNGTEFDLSAAFAPDTGDSDGATQTLAKRAPDSVTEPESAEEVQSRGLRVIDTTGRLPRNPADWPEELKQAVAECCCGGSSSGSSSSGRTITCCDTANLGDCLQVIISGGSVLDGTYILQWEESVLQWRSEILPHPCVDAQLWFGAQTIRFYSNGCELYIINDEGTFRQAAGPAWRNRNELQWTSVIQCDPYITIQSNSLEIPDTCNLF